MMNTTHRAARWAALALLFCLLALCFSGCEIKQGYDGKSAYELAVAAGFTGTEEEWLRSLQGSDGRVSETTVLIPDGAGEEGLRRAALSALRSTVSVRSDAGAGSGVIWQLDERTGEAYILTNYHVVYDKTAESTADTVSVFLYGSEQEDQAIPATVLRGSLHYDLALLHVGPNAAMHSGFACPIGESATPATGDTALVVGNAKGHGVAVTRGIVSVASEYVTMTLPDGTGRENFRYTRLDAAVNRGNSGGGLYDGAGRFLGIVSAKNAESDTDNIGYAIPADLALAVAKGLLDGCPGAPDPARFYRAFLGVTVRTTNPRAVYLPDSAEITEVSDVVVEDFAAPSLLYGKMAAGDRITAVQVGARAARPVDAMHDLTDEMLYARPGDTVTLTYERAGVAGTVSVTVPLGVFAAY